MRYYDLILNESESKVTIKPSQGKYFWLIGINNVWNKDDKYKAECSDGIVTWNIEVDNTIEGWDGSFKICGENTTDTFYGEGEWYNSDLDSAGSWGGKEDTYSKTTPVLFGNLGGDYGRKWRLTESGNFTIVFDTKNLTLTVSKND